MIKMTFTLYISGDSLNSRQAVENVHRFGNDQLQGNYELVVIDLDRNPEEAFHRKIMATPLLIRESPEPVRKVIGSLSQVNEVMQALFIL